MKLVKAAPPETGFTIPVSSLGSSTLAEEVSRADEGDGGPEMEKNAEKKKRTDRAETSLPGDGNQQRREDEREPREHETSPGVARNQIANRQGYDAERGREPREGQKAGQRRRSLAEPRDSETREEDESRDD